MTTKRRATRQYWLWVTRPEYYLEEDASGKLIERRCLEPSKKPRAWWTCAEQTRAGDWVLLYRTAPKQDIAYLIEAASDAYEPPPRELQGTNWRFVCDYRVVEKFPNPLHRRAVLADPVLKHWAPARCKFRRRAFRIEQEHWRRLVELLAAQNPEARATLETTMDTNVRLVGDDDPELGTDSVGGSGRGDPETNKEVESRAIRFVVRHFRKEGWKVRSVERDGKGYDLECTRGKRELHVEVKGIQGEFGPFLMTAREVQCADEDPLFVLCVVARATSRKPKLYQYTQRQFWKSFQVSISQYRVLPRDRKGRHRRSRR